MFMRYVTLSVQCESALIKSPAVLKSACICNKIKGDGLNGAREQDGEG